jgi:hypothetical protein
MVNFLKCRTRYQAITYRAGTGTDFETLKVGFLSDPEKTLLDL